MAGQLTGTQMAYAIASSNQNTDNGSVNEIPRYRLVKLAGEGQVALTGANEVAVGVTTNDERLFAGNSAPGNQAGRNISVQLDKIGSVLLSGTVTAGDRLISAANGKAAKIGTTAGQYNVVGFAEKSGVAGDVIPFRIAPHQVDID